MFLHGSGRKARPASTQVSIRSTRKARNPSVARTRRPASGPVPEVYLERPDRPIRQSARERAVADVEDEPLPDRAAEQRHVREALAGQVEGIDREAPGLGRAAADGGMPLDLAQKRACRDAQLRIRRLADDGHAQRQRLQLRQRQGERRQEDRLAQDVAHAPLALDGHARCGQRVHVPIDRPLRHGESRRDLGEAFGAAHLRPARPPASNGS